MKEDHNQTEIADLIEVHKSTISRELRRNRGLKGHRPKQAHQFAMSRRFGAQSRIDGSTWHLVERLIRQDLSPEQVPERLKKNQGVHISHERIYTSWRIKEQEATSTAICAASRRFLTREEA